MEIARDEVRVMTVHGAKGLEAPIVYLADTTTRPEGHHPERLLSIGAPERSGLVWAGSKDSDPLPVAVAREARAKAARDEYRRLLYVAMTRAAERLIVCGTSPKKKKDESWSMPDNCWYRLIADALTLPEPVPLVDAASLAAIAAMDELPKFLSETVAPDAPPPAPLRPSDKTGEEEAERQTGTSRAAALARGTLVHRLLQSLPEIPPDKRRTAAERFLAQAKDTLGETERGEIAERVLAILDTPLFQPLFAPGSRAEVPIVGNLMGRPVSGQIDRLAVADRQVLIADYKTDRIVPARPDDVPHYLRQLALYRAVLQRVFPGREVRAALVFTEGPHLMELPAVLLDAETATLTPA
jgi:ATP-dependent helicase/nuclease subunit A